MGGPRFAVKFKVSRRARAREKVGGHGPPGPVSDAYVYSKRLISIKTA